MSDFICFDEMYLVEIDKAFTKDDFICFTLKDSEGIFKFKRPKDDIVKSESCLGRFLHLNQDKRLHPSTIKDIVSTFDSVDTYICPIDVKFILNPHKNKRRIPYE